jgi:hypothetical protein
MKSTTTTDDDEKEDEGKEKSVMSTKGLMKVAIQL